MLSKANGNASTIFLLIQQV